MKTSSWKAVMGMLLVVGLITLPAVPAKAAKKVDFSRFGGSYRGTWGVTASGTAGFGNISADVAVPKNGSKMAITISGFVTISSLTYPIQTTFRFTSKRKLTGDAFLMGLAGPILTLPSKFSGAKNFSFALTAAPGATLAGNPVSGTMFYTLKFTKSGLSILGAGDLSGSQIQVIINARKKKKS
jgi:hypothetical protein